MNTSMPFWLAMILALAGAILAILAIPLIADPDSDMLGFGLFMTLAGGACLGMVLSDGLAVLFRRR